MPTARTLGIDLSTDPKGTASCKLNWSRRRVRVEGVWPSEPRGAVVLDELVAAIAELEEGDKAGIDCPFGWPLPFVREVEGWAGGKPWGAGSERERLRYRRTDLHIRAAGHKPLSVSSDYISSTAMLCARLLSQLEGVDRTGTSGPAAEVYPAAALRGWGIVSTGYKDKRPAHRENAREKRAQILEALEAGLEGRLELDDELRARMLEREHDLLDALICALVARAVQLGATTPPSDEEAADAAREGWIHLPNCELAELL